jgi:sugar fermentation stimulation protein A
MNGLMKRINRHRKKQKKLFWHIDYLLNSKYAKIFHVIPIKTDEMLECALNKKVSELPGAELVKGFGCSDCKCESHLFYFKEDDFKKMMTKTKPL